MSTKISKDEISEQSNKSFVTSYEFKSPYDSWKSVKEFYNHMIKQHTSKRFYSEVFKFNHLKFYIDYECKRDNDDLPDDVEIIEEFCNNIIELFKSNGIDIDYEDIVALSASDYEKISFHFIVNGHVFSRSSILNLAKQFQVPEFLDNEIDFSVYKKDNSVQNFRLLYNRKNTKNDIHRVIGYYNQDTQEIEHKLSYDIFKASIISVYNKTDVTVHDEIEKSPKTELSIETKTNDNENTNNKVNIDNLSDEQKVKLDKLIEDHCPGFQINGLWNSYQNTYLLEREIDDVECLIHKKAHKAVNNNNYLMIFADTLNVVVGCCKNSSDSKEFIKIGFLGHEKLPWFDTMAELLEFYNHYTFKSKQTPQFKHFVNNLTDVCKYNIDRAVFIVKNNNGITLRSQASMVLTHFQSFYIEGVFTPAKELRSFPIIKESVFRPTTNMYFKPVIEYRKDKSYNIFQGFKVLSKTDSNDYDKISPIINHIKNVLTSSNKEQFDWFIKYLYNMYYHPEVRMSKMLIMVSPQGTGKTAFTQFMIEKVFGVNSAIETSLFHVIGRFSDCRMNKTLISINELDSEDGKKSVTNKLKSLVSENYQTIEIKGLPTFTMENYANIWLTSNNITGIHLDKDDRRGIALDIDPKPRSQQYFNELFKCFNQEDSAQLFVNWLYDYAHELKINCMNQNERPVSKTYNRIVGNSKSIIEEFIDNILDINKITEETDISDINENTPEFFFDDKVMIFKKTYLYEMYIQYCEEIKAKPTLRRYLFDYCNEHFETANSPKKVIRDGYLINRINTLN